MADTDSSHQDIDDETAELTEEDGVVLTATTEDRTSEPPWYSGTANKTRALVAFWLLGLCNNFGYVVMLSAAYDILQPKTQVVEKCHLNDTTQSPYHLICNQAGTGNILLADILPTLLIKFTAPFYMHRISYNLRVSVIVLFITASFVLVAIGGSQVKWLSYMGVVSGSIGCGLGEIVFLSLSSHYPSNTISTWSSGTGAAGVFGAISYTGLTQLGLSAKGTLLCMLVIPLCLALSYFVLMVKPPAIQLSWSVCSFNKMTNEYQMLTTPAYSDPAVGVSPQRKNDYTFIQMLKLVRPLLKFMIPLMVVYMAEYFINQALFELLYFVTACSWLSIEAQYRWFQTVYQVGVFISRSSVNCFKFKYLWILPILQLANVAILINQVLYHYMPENNGIWIVFALILFEGCLGGTGYVQTFYQISQKVEEEHKEFSMGIASVADTTGIVISAFVSIVTHNSICNIGVSWK